ncbi:hypothetical protein [Microvirga roseola]|uniref:hypothetical protein n=1 Tax=Microvirga roseola TaxID=2883126 RepID=UPI001E4CED74|nr:hypothetical protein [Microvirga roseola]
MTIRPPILVIYGGCTSERAIDIIWDHHLRNCELLSRPISGIWFNQDKDLFAFKLAFSGDVEFDHHLAIVFAGQQEAADAFISDYAMESRVKRTDLLGVLFWDRKDQRTFEEGIGLSRTSV